MTKKTRRFLFIAAVLLFVVISPTIVFYARGYRWDFRSFKFLPVGAIYLESKPKEAVITLNNRQLAETTPALIKNLSPNRKYRIRIGKDGFFAWQKQLTALPGLVTQAKNIILFPEKLAPLVDLLERNDIADFSASPDGNFIAFTNQQKNLYFLAAPATTTAAGPLNFGDKKITTVIQFERSGKGWSPSGQKFLFARQTPEANAPVWYIWDTEKKTLTNLNNLYERQGVLKSATIAPLPKKFSATKIGWTNENNIITLINGQLFQLDLESQITVPLGTGGVIDFEPSQGELFILQNPDTLTRLNISTKATSTVAQLRFAPQKILLSSDGKKIAYFHNLTVGVLWLAPTSEEPILKAGEQAVVFESLEPIKSIAWHNSEEYTIVLTREKLSVAELDTRDRVNIWSWPQKIDVFEYLAKESKLFFLEEEKIKILEGKF